MGIDMEPGPKDSSDDAPSETAPVDVEALMTMFSKGRRLFLRSLGLPITVVLRSDIETTSIFVDDAGNVSVSRGALPDPNVVIEGSHATLCGILGSMESTITVQGPLKIYINKGDTRDMIVEIAAGETIENPLTDLLAL